MACTRPNTLCKLFYDADAQVEPGHFLATAAGSGYLVQSVRKDLKRPERQHLTCIRLPADEIPEGSTVHPLFWYARTKKSAHRIHQLST